MYKFFLFVFVNFLFLVFFGKIFRDCICEFDFLSMDINECIKYYFENMKIKILRFSLYFFKNQISF